MWQRLLLVSCLAVAPAMAQADTAVFASVGTRSRPGTYRSATTTPSSDTRAGILASTTSSADHARLSRSSHMGAR